VSVGDAAPRRSDLSPDFLRSRHEYENVLRLAKWRYQELRNLNVPLPPPDPRIQSYKVSGPWPCARPWGLTGAVQAALAQLPVATCVFPVLCSNFHELYVPPACISSAQLYPRARSFANDAFLELVGMDVRTAAAAFFGQDWAFL
jgi:hypothetical protein